MSFYYCLSIKRRKLSPKRYGAIPLAIDEFE